MSKKVYFITSVVPGADIHIGFAKAIEIFCKKNKAELKLIPTKNTVHKDDSIPEELEGLSNLVRSGFRLNSKIRIDNVLIDPASPDPVIGLSRQSQKDGSFIFGSAKQRLKLVPNGSNVKLPHALMSPGAITLPYYKDTKHGRIAKCDHVIGGLVVEIGDNVIYQYRQVQADKDGAFIDLGIEYSEKGTKKIKTEAVIPGDIHPGETDPNVTKAIKEVLALLKPKYTVVHDFFNGKSVNRHEKDRKASRAKLGPYISLEYELQVCLDSLKELADASNEVLIVRSNHDIWIDTYIEDARYIDDPINYKIGHQLAIAKHDGQMPFEAGVRMLDKKKELKNVRFLRLEDDIRVTPKKIQLAAHGHQGANGSKGTTTVIERTYGNSVTGHTHTPEILRGAWVVGTSTFLNLPYNEGGASSWLQTMGVVYYNGSRQLINVINGKWSV